MKKGVFLAHSVERGDAHFSESTYILSSTGLLCWIDFCFNCAIRYFCANTATPS